MRDIGRRLARAERHQHADGIVRASAAPLVGTWEQGDRVENGLPSAGGYIGWVCVVAGTPGQWKGYGLIQA